MIITIIIVFLIIMIKFLFISGTNLKIAKANKKHRHHVKCKLFYLISW